MFFASPAMIPIPCWLCCAAPAVPLPAACGGHGRCGKCRVSVNGVPRLACRVVPEDGDEIVLPPAAGGHPHRDAGSPRRPHRRDRLRRRHRPGHHHHGAAAVRPGHRPRPGHLRRLDGSGPLRRGCHHTHPVYHRPPGRAHPPVLPAPPAAEGPAHPGTLPGRATARRAEAHRDRRQHRHAEPARRCIRPPAGRRPPSARRRFFRQSSGLTLLDAPLYCVPCAAGFVGGDITAGLLASGLARRAGHFLFLDIGTNGEMALGGMDGFTCCAVAAGPALRGRGHRLRYAGRGRCGQPRPVQRRASR